MPCEIINDILLVYSSIKFVKNKYAYIMISMVKKQFAHLPKEFYLALERFSDLDCVSVLIRSESTKTLLSALSTKHTISLDQYTCHVEQMELDKYLLIFKSRWFSSCVTKLQGKICGTLNITCHTLCQKRNSMDVLFET